MKVLIHYTKYSTLKKILKSGGLKFGSMTNTNDPYEKHDLIGDIVHTGDEINFANNITEHTFIFCDRSMAIEANFQRFFQVLCFCYNKIENIPLLDKELERILMKPRMWSQYGYYKNKRSKYTGVAIILDKAKFDTELNNNTKNFQSDLISYDLDKDFVKEHRKTLEIILNTCHNAEELNEKIFEYYKKNNILLKKHNDWEEENEFRYIIEQQEDIIIPIQSSVLGIVLLEKRFTRVDEANKLIKKYAHFFNNKNLFFMNWERGFPTIQSYQTRKDMSDIISEAWNEKR